MNTIRYMEGYLYQLYDDCHIETGITGYTISTQFIKLDKNGKMSILKGYAWDGPSGPTIDTPNFMRGSLAHDALYQLMRNELLPVDPCRGQADNLLRKLCREDGMGRIRALWVYQAVKRFGKTSATVKREIITAP